MGEWLEHGDRSPEVMSDEAALRSALALAFERRWGLLRGDAFGRARGRPRIPASRTTRVTRSPGSRVDYFAGWAVVTFMRPGATGAFPDRNDARRLVLGAVSSFGFDGVYEKSRPKNASTLSDLERRELAPTTPSRGSPAASPMSVTEEGVPFLVRLDAGLATGFYADQRKNRQRVRAASSGKRVLNLFAYTCACA